MRFGFSLKPAYSPQLYKRFKMKVGVKCLYCNRIFFDKSNFNRHTAKEHNNRTPSFESNVAYIESGGITKDTCEWQVSPLPAASFVAASAAPGCLERQTKYLSRAAKMFSDPIWTQVSDPKLSCKDAAESLMDEIDDFTQVASTVVRCQVMRTKSNSLKTIPFQELKDTSGAAYAATLARFYAFAKIHFNACDKGLSELVLQAITEKCSAGSACCLEAFILCLANVAPNHHNADVLQHAAMHMRRILRGSAMLHLHTHPDVGIEEFCDDYLNMKRASSFAAMSMMYYEIKRCVPHDKRLLIHRSNPDAGYPEGSAVLVDTGTSLQRVSWAMMRSIVMDTLKDITSALNSLQLPGKDLKMNEIVDFEDSAIGSGLIANNAKLFDDNAQVRSVIVSNHKPAYSVHSRVLLTFIDTNRQIEWLKDHCKTFSNSRQVFVTLQVMIIRNQTLRYNELWLTLIHHADGNA